MTPTAAVSVQRKYGRSMPSSATYNVNWRFGRHSQPIVDTPWRQLHSIPNAAVAGCYVYEASPQSRQSNRVTRVQTGTEHGHHPGIAQGQTRLSCPARKRVGKASKRGLSSKQTSIVITHDRSGATTNAVLPRPDIAGLSGHRAHDHHRSRALL